MCVLMEKHPLYLVERRLPQIFADPQAAPGISTISTKLPLTD
jgi:hypothetical protein